MEVANKNQVIPNWHLIETHPNLYYSRIDPPVTFTENVSTVCLPEANDVLPPQTDAYATGKL